MSELDKVRRDFRTSSRFGIVGVIVVMAVVVVLALAFGQGDSNPTVLLAVIFAIVFGFVAVLMRLQRRDVDAAERRSTVDAVAPAMPVKDPATANSIDLIEALAVKPVDRAAIAEATKGAYRTARSSISSGSILMVLIALAVIPWQLWQFEWSIYIVVPVIVGYVLFLATRVTMPGGTLETAFEESDALTAPLGLEIVSTPEVVVRERVGGSGMQHQMVGSLAYRGTRHGRNVAVEVPYDGGATTTALGGAFPELAISEQRGRLHAKPGAPMAINAVLDPLTASESWKGVTIAGGPQGLVVERERDGALHWMRDLWLAERIADALAKSR